MSPQLQVALVQVIKLCGNALALDCAGDLGAVTRQPSWYACKGPPNIVGGHQCSRAVARDVVVVGELGDGGVAGVGGGWVVVGEVLGDGHCVCVWGGCETWGGGV